MAFHKQHAHGRAFHGLEARDMLEHEKRSGVGSRIKLNVPANDNKLNFIHNAGKAANLNDVVTVYSQVYVTKSKTFSGPAVYVTETGSTPDTASATPTTTQNSYESAKAAQHSTTSSFNYESAKAKQHSTQNSYESAKSLAHQSHARSSTVADGRVGGTPLSTSRGPTVAKGTPISASRGPNSEQISNKSQGMSTGGKAGLALGILAILGITAGLILFCIRRRKKQLAENGERLDEKHASKNSFFGGTAAAVGAPAGDKRASMRSVNSAHSRTGVTAPRLSLRPVTSLFPNMLGGGQNNTNQANNAPAMSEKQKNPFTDAAALSEKKAPSNPFEDGDGKDLNTPNHSAKPSWESSNAGTPQIGTAAAVPVGGAAPPRGPNNVHRVQLDFKPSMDDELELKSGQLVRMLHEYDDGWALCIRMDRSQQGVCPRTCLSKLPVKPRQGPPKGPQGRPMGPPPPGMRGPPPTGGNMMMPRPLTPTGRERSNTAGGRASSPSPVEVSRNRSQSVSAAESPVSPVESAVPARKPVPGQAA